jgi:hypothetical protein
MLAKRLIQQHALQPWRNANIWNLYRCFRKQALSTITNVDKWELPPVHYLKINVDGSFKEMHTGGQVGGALYRAGDMYKSRACNVVADSLARFGSELDPGDVQ